MRVASTIVLGVAALASAAAAQSAISAGELVKTAKAHLNAPIDLRGVFCYSATHGYQCRTTEPLLIVTGTMPAGPAKSAMDGDCGEVDGLEQSANCRFTLQMVPTEVGIQDGDYMRRGRQVRARITVVTATVISARKE
jgi:hypothetical protein